MAIKLKVPKKKDLPESVNQGDFYAELKQGGTVETSSRAFADWLIRSYELEEILPKQAEEGGSE